MMTRIEQMERVAILDAIIHAEGMLAQTATYLGLGRSTLYRKMLQYGIDAAAIAAHRQAKQHIFDVAIGRLEELQWRNYEEMEALRRQNAMLRDMLQVQKSREKAAAASA